MPIDPHNAPETRRTTRRIYIDAWTKARAGEPLEPLESQIVQILEMHPEYHDLLGDPEEALDRDWDPRAGEANPFLHLALHLAIVEQLGLDRPAGIRALHRNLSREMGDTHEAEHRIVECLARALWRAQHDGKGFDAKSYLKCIKRVGGRIRPRG